MLKLILYVYIAPSHLYYQLTMLRTWVTGHWNIVLVISVLWSQGDVIEGDEAKSLISRWSWEQSRWHDTDIHPLQYENLKLNPTSPGNGIRLIESGKED